MAKSRAGQPKPKPYIPEGTIMDKPFYSAPPEISDEIYKSPEQHNGVQLGIMLALETCCRCNNQFANTWGCEEPPLHQNMRKPCCPNCIGLDCVYCSEHYPGKMLPIRGTPFSRCPNCNPKPADNKFSTE